MRIVTRVGYLSGNSSDSSARNAGPYSDSHSRLRVPISAACLRGLSFVFRPPRAKCLAVRIGSMKVKYDGYRLRVDRDGDRVRLITRGGYDWTNRYPWIVEAARKLRQKRFVLDGEAVVPGEPPLVTNFRT